MPSFSLGGMGNRNVCTEAYLTYVLRIPSGHTQMDLSTHYGVYFFIFTEWHHRNRIYRRLSMSEHSRVIPVLCVRTSRHYGQGTTMTTMYIIQLFIRKRYHYKNQLYNLLINIYYRYLLSLWPESGNNLPKNRLKTLIKGWNSSLKKAKTNL